MYSKQKCFGIAEVAELSFLSGNCIKQDVVWFVSPVDIIPLILEAHGNLGSGYDDVPLLPLFFFLKQTTHSFSFFFIHWQVQWGLKPNFCSVAECLYS